MASSLPNFVLVSSHSSVSSSTLQVPGNGVHTDHARTSSSSHRSPQVEASSGAENALSDPPNPRLYQAMWHSKAGLITSPNVAYIPRNIIYLDSKGDRKPKDFSQPQKLGDEEVYKAFRPRFARNEGALFGRLNLSQQALTTYIVPAQRGRFILSDDIIASWTRLEDALLDVGDNLFSHKPRLPRLDYPKLPCEYGYRESHASREVTLRCAVRSRDAFLDLSAVVSFALSLYMTPSGALHEAYRTVMLHSTYKPHRAWFDLLASSYVCNFSQNFRVGGYVDPYHSLWMPHIDQFIQANVPIWVLWGHHYKDASPRLQVAFKYLPPDWRINEAKLASSVSSSLKLPIYRYDPFAINHGQPLPTPLNSNGDDTMVDTWSSEPYPNMESTPDVQPASPEMNVQPASPNMNAQLVSPEVIEDEIAGTKDALAAVERFFELMEKKRERKLALEKPSEKQSREAKERNAAGRLRYSKSSTMYEWRKQTDGTYNRVQLESKEFDSAWENHTRNQRRYVGHEDAWELCLLFPRYSDEFTKETEPWDDTRSDYESDDGEDDEDFTPPAKDSSSLKLPAVYQRSDAANTFIDDLAASSQQRNAEKEEQSDIQRLNASRHETFDFTSFIKSRFGYDLFSLGGQRTKIVPSNTAKNTTAWLAMMALSFKKLPDGDDVEKSIILLVHVLSNPTWTFRDLPNAFDHVNENGVSLWSTTLRVDLVLTGDSPGYIIHAREYIDVCPWSIFTREASTVLLIFRSQWPTVDVIARELIARGVRFNTVIAVDAQPVLQRQTPSRGLGDRPENYKPTDVDYVEYLRRREDLLKGPKGRAALMHGGIVARIARDVVEPHVVLSGPSSDATTIGKYKRYTLNDDVLSDNDVDIICGVYHVEMKNSPANWSHLAHDQDHANGTSSHMSWWPKDTTWNSMAAYLRMEWTEGAEAFYESRLQQLQKTPEKGLFSASHWRRALRRKNALTREIEEGTEHYQAGYLEDCIRQIRSDTNHR